MGLQDIEQKFFMDGPFGRFVRAVLSLAITSYIAKHENNVWYISAAPLIQTATKWLRDKYPGKWEWLPI